MKKKCAICKNSLSLGYFLDWYNNPPKYNCFNCESENKSIVWKVQIFKKLNGYKVPQYTGKFFRYMKKMN